MGQFTESLPPRTATAALVRLAVNRTLANHQPPVHRQPKTATDHAQQPMQLMADAAGRSYVRRHLAALRTEQFGFAKAHRLRPGDPCYPVSPFKTRRIVQRGSHSDKVDPEGALPRTRPDRRTSLQTDSINMPRRRRSLRRASSTSPATRATSSIPRIHISGCVRSLDEIKILPTPNIRSTNPWR